LAIASRRPMLVPCGPIGPPAPVNFGVRFLVLCTHQPLENTCKQAKSQCRLRQFAA
jgi:hypothetical protein